MIEQKINKKALCLDCANYYLTWENNFPYGCKAFGFKSSNIPCKEVKKSSGDECLYYVKKKNIK